MRCIGCTRWRATPADRSIQQQWDSLRAPPIDADTAAGHVDVVETLAIDVLAVGLVDVDVCHLAEAVDEQHSDGGNIRRGGDRGE
ncbi:MAG: hypothetical protein ABI658_28145 [Acidimicrobiales bacterium]